jgi:ATPase family associated with various cellular activities (AAA)
LSPLGFREIFAPIAATALWSPKDDLEIKMGKRDKAVLNGNLDADVSAPKSDARRHGKRPKIRSYTGGHDGKSSILNLALGLRLELSKIDLEELACELANCCRFYVTAETLQAEFVDTNGASQAATEQGQASEGDHDGTVSGAATMDVPGSRKAILNPLEQDDWISILDEMSSYRGREEACWIFARTLAELPPHLSWGPDLRVTRLCALRVAAASQNEKTVAAAYFDLAGLLVELLADPEMTIGHRRRAQRLLRNVAADLQGCMSTLYDVSREAERTGLSVSPPFWTLALANWAHELNNATYKGFLLGDTFLKRALPLISREQWKRNKEREMKIPPPVQPPAEPEKVADNVEKSIPTSLDGLLKPGSVSVPRLPLPPTKRVMEYLDLSPHGDEAKSKYAQQFLNLTEELPLTPLPSHAAILEGLGRLQRAMPNFAPVIETLRGDFAFALRSDAPAVLHLRPMLILGPPAIGKTRFAKELAKTLGAISSYLTTAGDADNRRFAGTAFGFSSSHPSWPVERISKLKRANPVLILDEIEKAGGSKANGVLADTILGLLEPESATEFSDPFLGGPIDLSAINWIFLANSAQGLSEPLMSRLEVFQVEPPGPETFDMIVETLLADICKARRIDSSHMPTLPKPFLNDLRIHYARRRDLRRLKAAIEKAMGVLAQSDNEHLGETLH